MASKTKKTFPVLTENERMLLEKAPSASVEEVKALLQEKDVKVDCLDKSGMTPLQHAAFRNRYETAELLIAHGADVNSNDHENGYTALMFAALSGNPALTRLMLTHGAKKDHINSVGRNSAQMAAFVGQHQCVAVINNYYDKSDLEYYTQIQGQEEEPKLPPHLLPALLKLMNMSNMHPVKISLHLQQHKEMMDDNYKVCKVLDLITEKSMKARDTDDVMAMKSHYFATIIRKAKEDDDMDTWIKKLVKGRAVDGYPELQDQLIRQSLKEFPFVESQLLLNMVRQLSSTKIGDDPTSLNILMQGVNGQKFGFGDDVDCSTCGEPKAEKKCSKCKMDRYCNQECQKLHWPTHKKFCKQRAEEFIRLEKAKEEQKKRDEAAERMREEEKRVIEEEKAYAQAEQQQAQEEREEALKEKYEAEEEREEAKKERLEAMEERKEAELERESVQKEKREAELERLEAEDEVYDAEMERLEAEAERKRMEHERKAGEEGKKEVSTS